MELMKQAQNMNLHYPIWNTKKEPCIIIIKLGSYFTTSQVLISIFSNLVNSWYFHLSNAIPQQNQGVCKKIRIVPWQIKSTLIKSLSPSKMSFPAAIAE